MQIYLLHIWTRLLRMSLELHIIVMHGLDLPPMGIVTVIHVMTGQAMMIHILVIMGTVIHQSPITGFMKYRKHVILIARYIVHNGLKIKIAYQAFLPVPTA